MAVNENQRTRRPEMTFAVIIQLCHYSGVMVTAALGSEIQSSKNFSYLGSHFPGSDLDDSLANLETGRLLSRSRRAANDTNEDRSFWEEIEEFYSDKNNMAMFCVLPVLVTIYGGCSAIYCVHKCLRYLRRRKHKRLRDEEYNTADCSQAETRSESSNSPANDKDRPVSQISSAWADLHVDASREGKTLQDWNSSPLPWQVPSTDGTEAEREESPAEETAPGAKDVNGVLQVEELCDIEGARTFSDDSRFKHMSEQIHKQSPGDVISLASTYNIHKPVGRNQKVPARSLDLQSSEETRHHSNLETYATNKSTSLKAADYSRFADSRSIEITPLSADPNLRTYVPQRTRPSGEAQAKSRDVLQSSRPDGAPRTHDASDSVTSTLTFKEDILARYDALCSLQMAQKTVEILNPRATQNKDQSRPKATRKKHIFVTE